MHHAHAVGQVPYQAVASGMSALGDAALLASLGPLRFQMHREPGDFGGPAGARSQTRTIVATSSIFHARRLEANKAMTHQRREPL
jgi:hypothetical protein